MYISTCVAPVNIAVIKYWGKRDEDLILPLNDSFSATLSVDQMHAKTTVVASPSFQENRFWLNGKEESSNKPRLLNCLNEIKKRSSSNIPELINWNVHICSENNFPTAAGLASSAAGYACLVFALANLYGITENISGIARMGSGSACRSIYGGWVQWHKGVLKDGTDSIATQFVPASHWPEMRIIILVVSDKSKKDSSTTGMKRSVATSSFLKYRSEHIVPERINSIKSAIRERDFETFANITMQDSNQFHSVCLDTFPPCKYMDDTSYSIIDFVHAYNNLKGATQIAYTFDAGPNACLYLLENNVPEVVALIRSVYLDTDSNDVKGIPIVSHELSAELKNFADTYGQHTGAVKYLIHTKVGNGPKILTNPDDHLLNTMGLPKSAFNSEM